MKKGYLTGWEHKNKGISPAKHSDNLTTLLHPDLNLHANHLQIPFKQVAVITHDKSSITLWRSLQIWGYFIKVLSYRTGSHRSSKLIWSGLLDLWACWTRRWHSDPPWWSFAASCPFCSSNGRLVVHNVQRAV